MILLAVWLLALGFGDPAAQAFFDVWFCEEPLRQEAMDAWMRTSR